MEEAKNLETTPVEPETEPSGLERLGAVFCQASFFLGLAIIIPLIFVLAVNAKDKPFVYHNAKQSLIFQLVIGIATVIWVGGSIFLVGLAHAGVLNPVLSLFFGLVSLAFLLGLLVAFILNIIAIVKAAIGSVYCYPFLKK
jgi:uncharacterized Tic20 family protein